MRRKSPVLVTGIAAAVSVLAALTAVLLTHETGQRPFKPEPYFPGLQTKLNQATRIHIQSKDALTDLQFAPETGWTVPSKDGYRARYDEIQRLALELSSLERFERKTKEAKWQKRLLLTDPREKGEGTLVQFIDAKGNALAQLLIGLNADVENTAGKAQVYVRAPGDNQVWLARGEGVSTLSATADDWLDKDVVDLSKDQISRVDVKPLSGPAYAIVHPKPDDKGFVVEGQPGLKLKSTSVDALADGLLGLRLRDVARQDRIQFTETSPIATFRTTDGLVIRADVAKLGEDYWARLTPAAAEGASDQAKKEADSLMRRLSPWVYEIERWKGDQIVAPLTDLQDLPPEQKPIAPSDANPSPVTAPTPAPAEPPPGKQNAQKKSKPATNKPAKPHQ